MSTTTDKYNTGYDQTNQTGPPQYVHGPPTHQAYPMQPAGVMISQPQVQEVKDHLVWSILSCIFCFFCTGIPAIIYSVRAKEAQEKGNQYEAMEASRTARTLNIVSTAVGSCLHSIWIVTIIILAVGGSLAAIALGAETSSYNEYYG